MTSPARILAVTRLAIDVVEDLQYRNIEDMSPAETGFAILLYPLLEDLRSIAATALTEMNQLAPRLLEEAYPAPG